MSGPSGGRIGALDKAIDILEILSRDNRGLPLTEIARRLNLNTSTAHHLLATLRERGFADQDQQTRTYRLGYGLVRLVGNYLAEVDIYSASFDAIRELRDLSGETAYLTVLEDRQSVALIVLSGTKPIQVKRPARPGQARLHSTASGKVLLAYLPREQSESLLSSLTLTRFTPNTMTSRRELRAEFEAIRQQGYALDREEDYVGIACVAAPVFASHGQCVATASVSLPAAHMVHVDTLIELVCDTARTISANLGHAPLPPSVRRDGASVPAG